MEPTICTFLIQKGVFGEFYTYVSVQNWAKSVANSSDKQVQGLTTMTSKSHRYEHYLLAIKMSHIMGTIVPLCGPHLLILEVVGVLPTQEGACQAGSGARREAAGSNNDLCGRNGAAGP